MKTVIEMAREAGAKGLADALEDGDWEQEFQFLERFTELVRADEREACAKVADHWRDTDDWPCGDGIGRAIRARSNT